MTAYLSFKALHLIAMVAWFAGLFYLPRLFVYHLENPRAASIFITMERKLAVFIMRPAVVATWGFGFALLYTQPYLVQMGWMHAKLGLVLLLTAYHLSLELFRHQLAAGTCRKSARFFRLYNEVPTLLLVAIILLAVFKPV